MRDLIPVVPSLFDNEIFDRSWDDLFKLFEVRRPATLPTDIYEEAGTIFIEMAVSGFSKEDIIVDIKDDILTISTNMKKDLKELETGYPEKTEGENRKYIQKGLARRYFKQSYRFKNCDLNKADAKLEDGILKVSIPKKENGQAKEIEIK